MNQNKEDKPMKIKPIRNGFVIDHIPRGRSLDVLKILGVDRDFQEVVAIAINVPSKVLGKKDIVKVENRDIETVEINRIAIIAPNASINRIRDFEVVQKEKVILPDEIVGTVKCPNPKCVTNKEREPVKATFLVVQRDPLVISCKYCEREIKGLKF